MGPCAVGERAGEGFVFRAGEPIGEEVPGIAAGEVGFAAAEEAWFHLTSVDGMFGSVLFRLAEDVDFRGSCAAFLRDSAEEGREAIVVIHGPAVEWMMMALGALDAGAKEQLSSILRALHGLAGIPEGRRVEIRGRVGEIAAFTADEIADDLMERAVGRNLAAEPLMVLVGGPARTSGIDVVIAVRADLKDFRPLHGPDVREFRRGQQFVDESIAFVRRRIRREGREFFRRRRQARQIKTESAEEGGVVRRQRRRNLKLPQPRKDRFVDEIDRGDGFRPCEVVRFREHDDFRTRREFIESAEDPCAAAVGRREDTITADGGGRFVIGKKESEPRDIAAGAIRIIGHDHRAVAGGLSRGSLEQNARRQHADAGDRGCFRRVVRSPVGDPLVNRGIERTIRLEAFATSVRDRTRRLFEKQGFLRRREIEASTDEFLGEPEVIARRVEAEQRKPESILATSGPVTRSGIAARPEEDRQDIETEGNRPRVRRATHLDRHRDRFALRRNSQGRRPVREGAQHAVFRDHQRWLGSCHNGFSGEVARRSIGRR